MKKGQIDNWLLVLSFIYSLIIRRSRHHFKTGDLQTQCIGGYNKNQTKIKQNQIIAEKPIWLIIVSFVSNQIKGRGDIDLSTT